MSNFSQLTALEAGRAYSDDPGFKALHTSLVSRLLELRRNISKLTTDVNLLGTKRDTARVRERSHAMLEKSRGMCKDIGEGIKKLDLWEGLTTQQKYEQAKVASEFQTALQEFQEIQRKALDRQRASVTAARSGADAEHALDSEGEPQLLSFDAPQQQQEQQEVLRLANQDEVDFQESLIVQREEEIRAIEQGVGDLNVLFRQVAQIVGEQGEQLHTIADRVENVRDDTQAADRENRQAARYQRAARNKSCCLLLVMTLILTIVLLAIFLG